MAEKDVARLVVALMGTDPKDLATAQAIVQELGKGGRVGGIAPTPAAPRADLPPGRKRRKRRTPEEMREAEIAEMEKSAVWHAQRGKPFPTLRFAKLWEEVHGGVHGGAQGTQTAASAQEPTQVPVEPPAATEGPSKGNGKGDTEAATPAKRSKKKGGGRKAVSA